MTKLIAGLCACGLAVLNPLPALGQDVPGQHHSPNVRVMSHVPLGIGWTPTEEGARGQLWDIEVEQELSRPYVYVSRSPTPPSFEIISIKDVSRAQRIYRWVIESPELNQGRFSNGKYFKL